MQRADRPKIRRQPPEASNRFRRLSRFCGCLPIPAPVERARMRRNGAHWQEMTCGPVATLMQSYS